MAKATLESATSKRDAELLEWSGSVDFSPSLLNFVKLYLSDIYFRVFIMKHEALLHEVR